MRENYERAVTDLSLEELKVFSKWYNDKIGHYPLIVGGWAVYCYTGGLGSKDIDVVFPGSKAKHSTLSAYFQTHGYAERQKDFFNKEFVKSVEVKGKTVDIIIDAVSSDRTITFDKRKARLPWNWAEKHKELHKLSGSTIYIPTVELLLVYKLGAVLGRSMALRTGIDAAYYRSKLWKDVYDVVSLSKLEVDASKVRKLMYESGLEVYAEEILQAMQDNFDDEAKSLTKEPTISKTGKLLTGRNQGQTLRKPPE